MTIVSALPPAAPRDLVIAELVATLNEAVAFDHPVSTLELAEKLLKHVEVGMAKARAKATWEANEAVCKAISSYADNFDDRDVEDTAEAVMAITNEATDKIWKG